VPQVQRRLITYCTNIHPGESWEETFAPLRAHVPRVRDAVSPEHPFPLGLRLSARAARELTAGPADYFRQWLVENRCFIPTINGFPFADFHEGTVKDRAYLPDWRSRERVEYTKLLATLLATWLPENGHGSISTVPVGFRAHLEGEDRLCARRNLLEVMEHLELLRREKGVDIVLSLEPEPGCLLETTEDVVEFIDWMNPPHSLRNRIGICLDCCHLALQFEEPAEVLSLLKGAGVRIGKVQVSSALRQRHHRREALRPFQEPKYLHQVVVRRHDGELSRYHDLPHALEQHQGEDHDEWRCHFHVPIFLGETPELKTTQKFIQQILPLLDRELLLEVETYSWSVLPPHLRLDDVGLSIIRELNWLRERVDETDRRS
jgi:hypothetical protein